VNAWAVDAIGALRGRWSDRLDVRLGRRVPAVQPGALWIHGASLGEVGIARRLADALPASLVTTDTASGAIHADAPRPWDHPWTLAPLWSEARPRGLVFVEGSWWPALAGLARRDGVPVVSVAARFHARRRLLHAVSGWPDRVWASTLEDVAGFMRCTKVAGVSGTLKGGDRIPNPLDHTGPFVAGTCTHEADEHALFAAWRAVAPHHTLVLAPRHVDRVEELLRRYPSAVARSAVAGPVPAGSLVVVDTLGELAGLLTGARVVLVGGTFDPRLQGHSPMEARRAGAVCVHGPCIANNRQDFVDAVAVTDPDDVVRGLREALARPRPSPPPVHPGFAAVVDDLSRLARPARESCPRPWARPGVPVQQAKIWMRARRRLPPGVITTGSRSARGAGKTSLAGFVAAGLRARGEDVVVVCRGVGAMAAAGDSRMHGPDAAWLGDEGAWLAALGLDVVAGRHALERGLARGTTVVLEDGLLVGVAARSVAIVDDRWPTARGPFPMGDDRGECRSPDVVVHLRASPEVAPKVGVVEGSVVQGPWSAPIGGPVAAFTGIARPVDFLSTLHALDVRRSRRFPNHHRYTPDDWRALQRWSAGTTLVTTTRDAVRLPRSPRLVHRSAILEVPDFPWDQLL
jgi:3-deoxy-D-manno-octulosonic-acid transferase